LYQFATGLALFVSILIYSVGDAIWVQRLIGQNWPSTVHRADRVLFDPEAIASLVQELEV
jgi:hypothetical protein